MKEIQFSIEINATKERVWATLWEDMTFRDWANIFDEGTYMKGVMKEGNEVQFISSVNGYGVTSLIGNLARMSLYYSSTVQTQRKVESRNAKRSGLGGQRVIPLPKKMELLH